MKIRFKEMQGRMADDGKPSSKAAIASMLGINERTITNIVTGNMENIRGAYIDALCAISGMTPGELIEAEPVTLPLTSKRPDRIGARVGERTKDQPKASDAARQTQRSALAPPGAQVSPQQLAAEAERRQMLLEQAKGRGGA